MHDGRMDFFAWLKHKQVFVQVMTLVVAMVASSSFFSLAGKPAMCVPPSTVSDWAQMQVGTDQSC